MENLEQMGKMFSRSAEFYGFKYSRLIRLLNLTDLKNIVTSIANRRGIQVTFVQPHYTSQTCKCGHINKANRTTQEMFCCVECGDSGNADTHSAINIEERMSSTTLKTKLLNEKNGSFSPKKLGKNTIKSILYDYYSSLNNELIEPSF